MKPLELTDTNFADTVKTSPMMLVDFWAAWCGPCRQFAPVFDQAAAKHPQVIFGKVNTETQQGLAAAAQITSIPTLMAFKEGIMVHSQPGALDANRLDALIAALEELDMDEVRTRMQQKATSSVG
ncbi:thioredoxin [Glutamicibacter uratoxydans]|uniref:thioredoxin n=1 Tax=Glutamicibacter uratoxydans TaxID=43667 RepID=UPI003D6DECC2